MGVWGSRVWQEREKQKPVPRPAFQIMDPSLDSRRAVLRSRARSFALRSDASRPRSWLRINERTRPKREFRFYWTPDSLFPIHHSLFTNHQTPIFAREAELARRSRTGRRRRLADLRPYHYGSHAEEPSSVLRPRSWTRPSKEQKSVPELGALFFVPTLRVHVLG